METTTTETGDEVKVEAVVVEAGVPVAVAVDTEVTAETELIP